MTAIQCEDLSVSFKKQRALDKVSFTLEENTICGILGRNGAGKTTLLSLLAAYRHPGAGQIRIWGEEPYENPRIMPRVSLAFNKNEENNTLRVGDYLAVFARFRPNWDRGYAKALLGAFDLPEKKAMSSLNQGGRAAVHALIGLASRTPLTIYDEVYLGLDAAYRKLLLHEILEDYMRFPRTILFSTHYIGEMESLFGEVLILDQGRLLLHEDCDTLRQRGITLSGEAGAVDRFLQGRGTLSLRGLGSQKEAVIFGALSEAEKAEAARAGLTLSRPPLQELFIHLTEKGKGEGKNETA
jgi:ABC-2 type transport system ATP-binding protein